MHNTKVGEKTIEVMIHTKKNDREEQGDRYTNLYIQNLPTQGFSLQDLENLFVQYGQITSHQFNTDKPGTGYVSFSKHEDAKKAVDEGSKMQIKVNNNAVIVMPHIYRKDNELQGQKAGLSNPIVKNQKEAFKSNIFVRFLPKDVTEEQIREKFSQAGKIASIKLKDHVNKINGESYVNYQNGYVLFEDVQAAQKCIKLFDESREFAMDKKPIKVDFWQSKVDLTTEREEKNYASL